MKKRIAIIGAGVAGCAAGLRLAQAGHEIVILEKSRGFSGRAASRSLNDCRYDYGANYFKLDSEPIRRLIEDELPADDLCEVVGDIDTFDSEGTIEAGDPDQNVQKKWCYRSGISQLGKSMVAAGGLDVLRECTVAGLVRSADGWWLKDADGKAVDGVFDAVVLTPPAPQTLELLRASSGFPAEDELWQGVFRALKTSEYHRQFSVLLNFSSDVRLPGDAYALLNSDRHHDLAWLSRENAKPGHVPKGQTLLVAQLSPKWTNARYNAGRDVLVEAARAAVAELLGSDLPPVVWADTQRWRYAHPSTMVDAGLLEGVAAEGLYFAGDFLVGKGRVSRAIETGFAVANKLTEGEFTP